jgi:hypothetical protein
MKLILFNLFTDELNNTVKFHLQQLESMKISHEEELVMMKRQMKVEQVSIVYPHSKSCLWCVDSYGIEKEIVHIHQYFIAHCIPKQLHGVHTNFRVSVSKRFYRNKSSAHIGSLLGM